MMNVDYFGEELNPGDKVLRAIYSEFQEQQIVRFTGAGVYLTRINQAPVYIRLYNRYWDSTTRSWKDANNNGVRKINHFIKLKEKENK